LHYWFFFGEDEMTINDDGRLTRSVISECIEIGRSIQIIEDRMRYIGSAATPVNHIHHLVAEAKSAATKLFRALDRLML
jgi:hypothetical protein